MQQRRHLEETIKGTMTLLCTIMDELWSSSHFNTHTGQQWLFLELFRGRNSVYETRRGWNTEPVSGPAATRSLFCLRRFQEAVNRRAAYPRNVKLIKL